MLTIPQWAAVARERLRAGPALGHPEERGAGHEALEVRGGVDPAVEEVEPQGEHEGEAEGAADREEGPAQGLGRHGGGGHGGGPDEMSFTATRAK